MSENVNLKQIERKAWISYFDDGLWDIMLGLTLMFVGIPALLPNIFTSELRQDGASAVLMGLAFGIFWAGKRFITVPRLGRARFGQERKAKQRKTAAIYAISVLAGVIAFLLFLAQSTNPSSGASWLGSAGLVALGIGAWMMLVFSLGSYFMDFTRGYVVGALYVLGFSGTVLLHNPIMLLFAGGITLLMGLVVFIRFLQNYPIPAEAAPDDKV